MAKDEKDEKDGKKSPKHAGPQKKDKPLKVQTPGKETGDSQAKGGGNRGK